MIKNWKQKPSSNGLKISSSLIFCCLDEKRSYHHHYYEPKGGDQQKVCFVLFYCFIVKNHEISSSYSDNYLTGLTCLSISQSLVDQYHRLLHINHPDKFSCPIIKFYLVQHYMFKRQHLSNYYKVQSSCY